MKLLAIIIASFLSLALMAHEGHENAPGSVKSIHGGTVQSGKELNIEVIINGRELTVFPISHEGKDILKKDIKVKATAKPKKGKPYTLKLQDNKAGYIAKVDLQGSNRLPVEISIVSHGKTDLFTVQIEE